MEFKESSSVNGEAPMHDGDVGRKTVEVSQLQTSERSFGVVAPSNTPSETRMWAEHFSEHQTSGDGTPGGRQPYAEVTLLVGYGLVWAMRPSTRGLGDSSLRENAAALRTA